MGRFENIVLGDVSGKVGNIVGRKRKGKHFVYVMPTEVKISNSPEAIKSRNIMIPLAKFASVVNSIPELKYIWAKQKIEAFDAFHKIEKVNFPLLIHERPTVNNTITPLEFPIHLDIAGEITSNGILIKTVIGEPTLREFDGAKELTGIGVICFFNPRSKEGEYFQLGKIKTSQFIVAVDVQIEINIPFDEKLRNLYNSYLNSIVYYTFISKDMNGTPLKFGRTYGKEFKHETIGEEVRFRFCDSQP